MDLRRPLLITSGTEVSYWPTDNLRNHQRPFGTSDREFNGPLFRPGPHEPSALPWPSHSIKPPTPKSLAVVPIDFGLLLSQQCYAASAVRGDETFLRPHVSLCKDDWGLQSLKHSLGI